MFISCSFRAHHRASECRRTGGTTADSLVGDGNASDHRIKLPVVVFQGPASSNALNSDKLSSMWRREGLSYAHSSGASRRHPNLIVPSSVLHRGPQGEIDKTLTPYVYVCNVLHIHQSENMMKDDVMMPCCDISSFLLLLSF